MAVIRARLIKNHIMAPKKLAGGRIQEKIPRRARGHAEEDTWARFGADFGDVVLAPLTGVEENIDSASPNAKMRNIRFSAKPGLRGSHRGQE